MRVAVTGIGMVNALGLSAPVVFNNLLNKVCGISSFYSNGELAIGGKPEFSKSPWRVHLKVLAT